MIAATASKQAGAADQAQTQFFDSNLIIKSDHEVGLRRYWYQYKQNFEPDLSMTVSRPYEANLGPKNAIFDFSKFAKIFSVENLFRPGRDRIPAGRGS